MLAADIMKRRVSSVPAAAPITEVARRMFEESVGFLPVLAGDRRVIGVITCRDVVTRWCAARPPAPAIARDVMTPKPVLCHASDSLATIEERMATRGVRRLVVVDPEDRLLGIVSLSDIAQCEEPIRLARLVRSLESHHYRVATAHA